MSAPISNRQSSIHKSSIFNLQSKMWTPVAVAAGVVLFLLVLPARPARLESPGWTELSARTAAGAYHIHTTRSDGIGDRTAVAAAAARAGLASLFDRPQTLDTWDRLTRTRPVVALAGADAHGGIGRRAEDTGRSLAGTIGVPSYEASFRAFSNRVVLDRPLSGRAPEDARLVYGAIRQGHVF